ncbi:Fic family protein [Leucothrix arctica]|uniref:Cell filamentation protein Fic n=1 Tax=Leucothrix arctica TaxID=1481894 RepID=A0A317CE17_9GAMM|nr:Fic family protein [Leucothrix arctica]PWQ96935.1 cell filamentation protein Fic [Leucothrix arctica]
MARIRKPKNMNALTEALGTEFLTKLPKLMVDYRATNSDGAYLHWDQFIWRIPKGANAEEAWLATKYSRMATRKNLVELKAKDDASFFSYCIPDSLLAKLHYIDKKTGGGHSLSESSFMSSGEKGRYLVKSLMMEEAITSSQLEGASTTRKVAKEMLVTQRQPSDKSEQMIFNNYLLMKKAVERKDEPLSIELILELHEVATYKAIDNDAVSGELRQDNNITVTDLYNEVAHAPPCHTSIQERLTASCAFANEESDGLRDNQFIHPLVKAIILHFMIGYIHPFGDGNGRTARALFYWFMLRSGYWLFEYVSISKLIQEKRSDYDKAYVYTETDDFDLTYFLYNQVDVVIKAVDSLHDHIESKKRDYYEFMEWIESSPVSKILKPRQLEILKDAVKHPGKIFTAKQVSLDFDINGNTARSHLNKLVDEDLLIATKSKKGKGVLYLAPADLRERLKL